MRTRLGLISVFVFLSVLISACGGQAAAAGEDIPPTAVQGVADLDSLVAALASAGATVETGDPVEQPFLAVKGQILHVNGADVQVFAYESPDAMQADASHVSDDGGSIGTSMVSWMEAPHFFKAGRVLVLYVGADQSVLDVLQQALGPQFAGR